MMPYSAWLVCLVIQYIVIYLYFEFEETAGHFVLPTTKGSMNAFIELFGLSTSNKVKNH